MATPKAKLKQMQRTDEMILDDIWAALWKEETIRAIDIHDISINVENGQACLSGHVSKEFNEQRIDDIARSTLGVLAVHNHLVSDRDLTIQIVQALNNDKLTRPYSLPVYCYHGWVGIGGLVPNCTLQHAAEEIAAKVPSVRGIVLPPDIEGEQSASMRDAVQPRIGVQVYGGDDTEGRVYQVVIGPQNRLVTHAIVRESHMIDGWLKLHDYLVPIEAMNCADDGNISLKQSAPAIHQFPIFNPVDYPFAPLTWQPPYPYAIGSVRWPRQEQAKPENK